MCITIAGIIFIPNFWQISINFDKNYSWWQTCLRIRRMRRNTHYTFRHEDIDTITKDRSQAFSLPLIFWSLDVDRKIFLQMQHPIKWLSRNFPAKFTRKTSSTHCLSYRHTPLTGSYVMWRSLQRNKSRHVV